VARDWGTSAVYSKWITWTCFGLCKRRSNLCRGFSGCVGNLEAANNHKRRNYEEIPGFNGLIQGLVHRECTVPYHGGECEVESRKENWGNTWEWTLGLWPQLRGTQCLGPIWTLRGLIRWPVCGAGMHRFRLSWYLTLALHDTSVSWLAKQQTKNGQWRSGSFVSYTEILIVA
jgi:hypothetical protein